MAIRIVRVASSLSLQKLLHFNTLYIACYGSTEIALSLYKALYITGIGTATNLSTNSSPSIWSFIPLILVCIWIIIEILRIRIGYLGNLQERVPELAAFWLLTLLPQLPLTIFISFISFNSLCLGLDIAVGIPMCIILLGQIRYGLPAVRSLIRKQTADFYRICQEEALQKESELHPPKYQPVNRNKGLLMYSNGSSLPSGGLPNVSDQELDQAVSAVSVTDVVKEGMRTLLTTTTTNGNGKDDTTTNRLVNQSTNNLLAKNNTSTATILRTNTTTTTNNNAGGTGLATSSSNRKNE